jgi:hypothetical protein
MNPLDVKKRLKVFAEKLSTHSPLSNEEREFLVNVFSRIANGEDANEVLGVKFGRGKSLSDAKKRQALSFIIHWIECAIKPVDSDTPGLGYTVSEACIKAEPILRKMLEVEDDDKYDAEYIRQCFYKPEFAHMRSVDRGAFDQDSPFQP